MKALVTRPASDAASVSEALLSRGIEPVLAPLLRIVASADGARQLPGALAGVQAVLFTSANGVRAYAEATTRSELPAFCVGEASAAAARLASFRAVFSADGNIDDLAALVMARLAPGNGALLHAAGEATAGDLGAALTAAGFTVRRVVLYRAEAASELPDKAVTALQQGSVEFALFFSPRSAATFVRLARDGGFGDACGRVIALALSANVAATLRQLSWREIAVADSPNLASLLAAMDAALLGTPEFGRKA
jgi:uroporphyrinogen-III synthase